MRKIYRIFVVVFAFSLTALRAFGQLDPGATGDSGKSGSSPIDISTTGETHVEGRIVYANGGVVIHHDTATIYCDAAQYNLDTKDLFLRGNIRIYNDGKLTTADRAVYNTETKQLHAAEAMGDEYPFYVSGDSLTSISSNAFTISDGIFTTSDSSKPDWHLHAKTVHIYGKNRIVLDDATLYVGQVPVFWFPYYAQNLHNNPFLITPGFDSAWGAFLLGQYTVPINDNITTRFHFDLRSKRGVAVGLDTDFHYGKDGRSWGKLTSYYLSDQESEYNDTAIARGPIPTNRYRVSLQSRLYVTDDIYANIDLNKLSDEKILEDFFPSEYRKNPQPDNYISLTKWNENFTLTAIFRDRVNDFFDMTERTPEVALDIKRQLLFGTPIFYEGSADAVHLRRDFANGAPNQDYSAARFDTFHQLSYPNTYFGWLNLIPTVGLRETYYDHTGTTTLAPNSSIALAIQSDQTQISANNTQIANYESTDPGNPAIATLQGENTTLQNDISALNAEQLTASKTSVRGGTLRTTVNANVEASFKLSRDYSSVDSRLLGLDGLRHVIQPYTDFSYVNTNRDPNDILQFDRVQPSTQLQPIDFPDFTRIDAITNWTIWRYGVRNRLETRRDGLTYVWLEMDSFVDLNINPPEFPGLANYQTNRWSNIYNNLTWNPLPWMNFNVQTQLPLIERDGFTEVNSSMGLMLTRNFHLTFTHLYLNNNPYFDNSSYFNVRAYYRLDDHWGVSVGERYEFASNTLEMQQYEIHRDLSSWIASLGLNVLNNGSNRDIAVFMSFTLKSMPQLTLPFTF